MTCLESLPSRLPLPSLFGSCSALRSSRRNGLPQHSQTGPGPASFPQVRYVQITARPSLGDLHQVSPQARSVNRNWPATTAEQNDRVEVER